MMQEYSARCQRVSASACDHQADAELREHAPVVIDQAFTVTVEVLQMQVAAQIAERRLLQRVGHIQLEAVRFGTRALAKRRGELQSVRFADLYQQVHVPAILGNVRVLLLVEVVVYLWRHRDEIVSLEQKGKRRSHEGDVDRTRGGAVPAVRFVLQSALESQL